ncbi:MAG: STAS domain-containing protein [Planctomycetes bacterium]|nr:STAS domain-containing protein [Planctomycetota bacterium]
MPVQQWNDDTLVVTLTDDPILSEEMAEVNALLRGAGCDVVLDLADLGLLTSSGISKLLRLRKHMVEMGRRLVLCSLSDRVWGVLLATGLDGLFEFAGNVTEALTRLESDKAGGG